MNNNKFKVEIFFGANTTIKVNGVYAGLQHHKRELEVIENYFGEGAEKHDIKPGKIVLDAERIPIENYNFLVETIFEMIRAGFKLVDPTGRDLTPKPAALCAAFGGI